MHQEAQLTWLDQQTDRASPAIIPVVPPGTEETDFRQMRASWRLQFEPGTWQTSEASRGWVGGLEWSQERGENSSLLLLPPSFGGPIVGDWDFERNTGAAFVEYFQQRSSGAVDWTIEAGVRLDSSFESDIDYDDQASPRIGLRMRPTDSSFTLRASWGQAFKLPSFYALASPRALGGNPDLEPESATSVDFGNRVESGHELPTGVHRLRGSLRRSGGLRLRELPAGQSQSGRRSRNRKPLLVAGPRKATGCAAT